MSRSNAYTSSFDAWYFPVAKLCDPCTLSFVYALQPLRLETSFASFLKHWHLSSVDFAVLHQTSTTWSTGKSPFPPAQISIVARKASLFQEGYGNNFLYDPLLQGLPAFYSDEAMNKIPKIGMVLEGWLQTCLLLLKALNKAILCCLSVAMKLLYLFFVASSFLKISSCYSRLFERHPIGAEGLFERIPRVFGPLLVKNI